MSQVADSGEWTAEDVLAGHARWAEPSLLQCILCGALYCNVPINGGTPLAASLQHRRTHHADWGEHHAG